VAELRQRWGLDQPLPLQYALYLGKLLQGDLGISVSSSSKIGEEIGPRFGVTLELALLGTLVAVVVGLTTGILSGLRPYTWVDYLCTTLALVAVSVPIFWSGLVGILIFSVQLKWLPSNGSGTLQHFILPAVTLGLFTAGGIARQTRSSVMEVLVNDYIRTARAKGLAERAVVWQHALKNAMIPVVTVIAIQFGRMLGGAIVTESVFALPGVGRYLIQAIGSRDYPVIQATVLILAVSIVLINVLVDLVYGLLDPRIRTS
jgi:ABC-type dipeptide/oligopeptide/nickel transport system permease component